MAQESFLKRTARRIFEKSNFQNTLVILPSGRSVYFFKSELQNLMSKTGWMPRIMTIEEFSEALSNKQHLGFDQLVLEVYPVYQSVFKQHDDSFRGYLHRVQMLLTDLNDIDSYGKSPDEIFTYLKQERALRLWSPSGEEPTPFQKKYLDFWTNLSEFHKRLTNKFDELNGGYSGYIFKKASENSAEKLIARFPDISEVHWIGFNVFNHCEEEIFNQIKERFTAQLHLDAAPYYLNNPDHEAGVFLKKMMKDHPRHHILYEHSGFEDPEKQIRTHGVSGEYAVAKTAGSLLKTADENERTALIAADENLLIPLLSSLPSNVDSVNVTMGVPLIKSSFYSFLNTLFELAVQSRRHSASRLPLRGLLAVFRHPVFAALFGQNTQALCDELVKSQRAFLTVAELNEEFLKKQGVYSDQLENIINPTSGVAEWFGSVLTAMKDKHERGMNLNRLDEINLEMLLDVMERASEVLKKHNFITDTEDLKRFLEVCSVGVSIPIKGERTDFLQVMGMLETRALDFDRIVVTSVNEGILPGGKKDDSMIPYEVKRYFGLPTHHLKDAVFAYHFYRLLQHPKEIDLVYDTSRTGLGAAEPSRFIKQLQVEWKEGNQSHTTRNFEQKTPQNDWPEIIKNAEVLDNIKTYIAAENRGISASAFNMYLNSPLDFYLQKVLKIEPPEEPEESMEHNTFGDVVHQALEQLFDMSGIELLASEHFAVMKKQMKHVLDEKFAENFKGTVDEGSNYLSYVLAHEMITRFLSNQEEECIASPFYVKHIEKKYHKSIEVAGWKCNVLSLPDRIDGFEDRYRIVDYKTGSVKPEDLRISSVDALFEDQNTRKRDKARQVMFYAWLTAGELSGNKLEAGIYSMRKLSHGFIPLKIGGSTEITPEHIEEFDRHFRIKIEEMLHPDIPLNQPFDAQYTLME